MVEGLHLSSRHREEIVALLHKHLPGVEVWAYGSRVNGQSHEGSDLDLVLRGAQLAETDTSRLADFIETLQDSTIPFLVEARDWARLPKSFHSEIEREHVVLVAASGEAFAGRNAAAGKTIASSPTTSWLYHPTFPQHWKPRPLHSFAEWVNGLAFRKIQFSSTGKPIIKIAEIKGGISGQTKFTNQTFDDSVRLQPGDLLFSWSGQPETSIDAFWWRGPEGWLNQHVFRVTPTNGIDTTFFYYLLRYLNPNFIGIARNKQTTGLGHVTKRDLKNIEAASPSLPEQRAIAHILGTLDDKIELNRRMNETLEAMARALFKSWFVDFDPLRAKMEGRVSGLPQHLADLFPDRLVDSELGEIPEGWEVLPLDEIAAFQNGLALQKYRPQVNEERLPVVKIAQLRSGKTDSGEWATSNIRPKFIIDDGDVVFSWSGSLMVTVWCSGRAALNQHLFKVTSTQFPKWFFLHNVRSHLADFQTIAAGKATTMGHIKRHHLRDAMCTVPDRRLLAAADGPLAAMFKRSVSANIQFHTFAALRDTLLPKLISGELEVKDAEQLIAEAKS